MAQETLPLHKYMSIAYITSASGTGGAVSSVTVSVTPTGSNSLVFVGVGTVDTNGYTISATYNGNSMTKIYQTAMTASRQIATFIFANGTADGSAHNVVVSTTSPVSHGIVVVIGAYSGCSQTGIPDNKNEASQTSASSISCAVTTVADNCWLVGFNWSAYVPSAGSGTTQRIRATSFDEGALEDSNGAKSPAGSYSLNVNWSGTAYGNLEVVSLAPATGGGGPTPNSLYFGNNF